MCQRPAGSAAEGGAPSPAAERERSRPVRSETARDERALLRGGALRKRGGGHSLSLPASHLANKFPIIFYSSFSLQPNALVSLSFSGSFVFPRALLRMGRRGRAAGQRGADNADLWASEPPSRDREPAHCSAPLPPCQHAALCLVSRNRRGEAAFKRTGAGDRRASIGESLPCTENRTSSSAQWPV